MRRAFIGILLFSLVFTACKDKSGYDNIPSASSFDKEAMLKNIGQNVVMAAYDDFSGKLSAVETAFSTFENDRSLAHLNALQEAFLKCYESWEHCSPFEFGPAAEVGLRQAVNVFPTDTPGVLDNVANGNYNLAAAQNANAIGLPAIEFLLFVWGSDQAAADQFATAEGHLAYIADNLAWVRERLDAVIEGWSTSGNDYLAEFSGNTTTSVGSPIGLLVNELNYDFELIKNARVGIPLGKQTLGVTQPEKVEALYSGHSVALALENLEGVRNGFEGGSGSGLDDYLNALGAKYNSQNLSVAISDGFAEARAALKAINGPLDEAIENNPSPVEEAYTALQNLVVLLKTDMPSQLGVQITYQDNDGD